MNADGPVEPPVPIPCPRSATDGPVGEMLCGCPCVVHESYGLAAVCQHTAVQLVEFTIRLSGGLVWVGTARWPTCQPCAHAIRTIVRQVYHRRLRQLAGEHQDGDETRG